jgi:type II secretory pathway component PulJ
MLISRTLHRARRARGLSIVELMVGVAVGLFVLAGAAMVVSNQLSDNKRLLLETQVNQDLRAAMDIIVRDIRRSGYSFFADEIGAVGAPAPLPIAYTPAGTDGANLLLYSYSVPPFNPGDPPHNRTVDNRDRRGFRLQDNVIQVQLSNGNWQALTDANVVRVTKFDVARVERPRELPTCGAPPCPSANGCGDQRIVTRELLLELEGEASHDARVQRRIEATVRVRNDGVCL